MIELRITLGEAIDRVTILSIKAEKIKDKKKQEIVQDQHDFLLLDIGLDHIQYIEKEEQIRHLMINIRAVNARLWDLENMVRSNELREEALLSAYRSITRYNTDRAALKRKINTVVGHVDGEVKEHGT